MTEQNPTAHPEGATGEVAPMPYASVADLETWALNTMQRAPDFIIGEAENPYMRRWWIVPRNAMQNVYLHEILRSDDDRALHDHPWPNTSFLIAGRYVEHMPDGEAVMRWPGDVVNRAAEAAHRLELPDGERAISLFVTGPKVREWGFHCPKGWVHWQQFTGGAHGEIVGAGCGEFS